MTTETIKIERPAETNIIIGQSHFIKTVEDVYEALVNSVPGIRFGIGFCEASGQCLVRHAGNEEMLEKCAAKNALAVGAGHSFIIIMQGAYPINVLRAVKDVPEVCSIYCATANDVEVIVAETGEARGILGVIDGSKVKGIETEKDIEGRKALLRKIGYKF